MLTESQVIHHVCTFLEARHFHITQRLTEVQRGYDIIATSPDSHRQIVIEAKGETSSKKHTARYGHAFTANQVYDHVAKAFYCASTYVAKGFLGGIAVPKNQAHEKHLFAIMDALKLLNVEVFWVSPDGSVSVAGHWSLWHKACCYEPQA